MSAGLQVRNDSGYLQVDGVNQHIVLLGKGSSTTVALTHGRTDIPMSTCDIPCATGQIAAIQSSAPWTVAGKYGGNWTIQVYGGGPGTVVNYWLFGPYTPSGVNYGAVIYDASGNPIWDTGRLPIRPIGDVAGLGTFTVGSAGRVYALFPQQLYFRLVRTGAGSSTTSSAGYTNLTAFGYGGFGNIIGQTLTSLQDQYIASTAVDVPNNQVPVNWTCDVSNNLQNTFTVIDVTNY
jgi:hypothetical protein